MDYLSRTPLAGDWTSVEALSRETGQRLGHLFVASSILCNEVVSFFWGHGSFVSFGRQDIRSVGAQSGTPNFTTGNFRLVYQANSPVVSPVEPCCAERPRGACPLSLLLVSLDSTKLLRWLQLLIDRKPLKKVSLFPTQANGKSLCSSSRMTKTSRPRSASTFRAQAITLRLLKTASMA